MRTLLLSQFYAPITGGEETHVRTLARELARRGHAVAVASLWTPGQPAFELDGDVRVYRLRGTAQRLAGLFADVQRRQAPPLPDPEILLGLSRVLARERPQIVHAHSWIKHSFLPLKRMTRVPLVVTVHDYSMVCAKKSLMWLEEQVCAGPSPGRCFGCAGRYFGRVKGGITVAGTAGMGWVERALVDMFLPVSSTVAELNGLIRHKLPYQVIPNFIPDHVEYSDGRIAPEVEALPKQGYILFVGDLRRFKGIDVLLRAYRAIPHAAPLVLIGRYCSDTPSEFPPASIALGNLPHAAVIQAWRGSLFGVLPSVGVEPFGIVALEAMAAGRPMIASRTGGLRDIVVDGETGLLLPPGDHVELAQAMRRLLLRPDLRERMGTAALRYVQQFRASRVVARIEQVYVDLVTTSVA